MNLLKELKPDPFLSALAAIVAIAIGCSLQGQTVAAPKDSNAVDFYPKVKALFEQYALATDLLDDRFPEVRNALVSLGPDAILPLTRLFQESQDDRYRTSAITTLFSIQGGHNQALSFVESELAKSTSEWHGRRWIFAAVMKTEEIDPVRAVAFATRALDLGDDQLVSPQALAVLERHGDISNIPRLDGFLTERRKNPQNGQARDGLAISAELAIKRIKQRSANLSGNLEYLGSKTVAAPTKVVAPQPEAAILVPAGSKPTSIENVSERALISKWWPWTLGGILLFSLLVFHLKKSKSELH